MNRALTLEDLSALADQHQAYSLVSCRQGGYSFRAPGAGLVHSTVNPAGEAMRQAREAGVVPGSRPLLLGCGLGWQALACLEPSDRSPGRSIAFGSDSDNIYMSDIQAGKRPKKEN